jgi:hypothetical protein
MAELVVKQGKYKVKPRWKPGESGNPKGRPPKAKCIPDILRMIGEEEVDTQKGKITKFEAILRVVYKKAVEGVPWAVEFIADRTEGRAVERVLQTEVTKDEMRVDFG